nr:hypothetical protein [Tanacetum cinerariifolium]
MDTLSLVSKYLNDLKEYLDDGDSLEARKLTIGKSKEELELFEASENKSVMIKEGKHRVVVFTKAPLRTYSKPFTRFSLPCDVDGQSAWDAEIDMADSFDYMTKERFDKLGFVRVDYGKYERKMVKEVRVEIHGFTFIVDFVVIGYANEGEPSVIFGRDFLVTSKSKVDFGIDEICIDLTMLEEEKAFDTMLESLVEKVEEIGSSNGELVKMRKASRNKQKEKVKEALDRKYKELEESKPILEVLENYMTYRKNLDEVMMGRNRLSSDEFGEEENMRTVEHGLPKKMCDPGNFVLPVRVNGTVEMNALADTGASVSVLPYSLFKNLGLSDPKPYNSNLTMAGNTQARAMREVRNVRIQIGYQAYLVDFLVLDILVDNELPLLLRIPFLRTCEAVIDMGCDTMSIDDGRDKDGNPKYGPVAPSFVDIKDDMDRALAMEAYFNPFKIIIVFKKLIDFLVITPSERKFTRGFKTKKTKRKLSEKFTSKDIFKFDHFLDYGLINPNTSEKATQSSHLNPLIANYEKRNKQVLLRLYKEDELKYHLFALHFTKLEANDKLFNHDAYWKQIGTMTRTNLRTSLIKEPLMRIMHRLLVGSLVHRVGSKERCQKRDLWLMSALEKSRGINLAWVIAKHLCKHALGLKENSLICGGHYVTEIAKSLGYLVDEEVAKCSEPIECKKWTAKMLASELDENIHTLLQTTRVASPPRVARRKRQERIGLNSSWGDWNASLNENEHQYNFAYPTYEPPNFPPYPYPYMPYPHPYTHYPEAGYEIGGSLGGVHGDDDDEDDMSDQYVRSENCVASDDDGDRQD